MKINELLKNVAQHLRQKKIRFALAGGLVASLYRHEKRMTKDLDFLILSGSNTEEEAKKVISHFSLTPTIIRKADLEGGPLFAIKRKNTPPWMVIGRAKGKPLTVGLDFILPAMPWFDSALDRAEKNPIDFGCGPVPCITVEDMILAKLLSHKNKSDRFKDLDDLQSIFKANHNLELSYLYGQMQKLQLKVPDPIKGLAPRVLKNIV